MDRLSQHFTCKLQCISVQNHNAWNIAVFIRSKSGSKCVTMVHKHMFYFAQWLRQHLKKKLIEQTNQMKERLGLAHDSP